MKKTYSKPDIFFEDFSLSTSIAAGCEVYPTNSTDACGVKWKKGAYLFTSALYGCNRIITDAEKDPEKNLVDSKGNGLCYHNPSADYNVFNS